MKLKKNYHNYSAVLLSGSLAMMYFLTYFSYSNYQLMPQMAAFVIMLVFTAFLVFAALQYNEQIIALIGILGAYLVPILLSDGSGKVLILFSYMTIISAGILFLAYRKNWLSLLYVSYTLSWLIFLGWYASKFNYQHHQALALIFSGIFFLKFYIALLANRISAKKIFGPAEIIILITNALFHFIIGYAALNHKDTDQFLGLFTVCTAAVHFVISIIIYKKDIADRQLYYLVSGLVLVFITLAIPAQLKGNWITVMWATEALLIFWIGRSKQSPVYEGLAYPVMVLAILSQITDWMNFHMETREGVKAAFLNMGFATGLITVAAMGVLSYLAGSMESNFKRNTKAPKNLIGLSFLILLFFLFFIEIGHCFYSNYQEDTTTIDAPINYRHLALFYYQVLARALYIIVFLAALTLFQIKYRKISNRSTVLVVVNSIGAFFFLGSGLYVISELREIYLTTNGQVILDFAIRYLALLVFVAFVFIDRLHQQKFNQSKSFQEWMQLRLQVIIVWVLSSELFTWLDVGNVTNTYKLGLSLLWGTYSLALIVYGIWKRKRFIRIAAFILFGITLVKLFLYDLARLSTISKTIVMVSLGLLLLIISFLYNKYKHQISNEE